MISRKRCGRGTDMAWPQPCASRLTPRPPHALARINQYLLKNWTEILLIPLIPSVFSLITVLFGTIILNTAALDCVQPLGSSSPAPRFLKARIVPAPRASPCSPLRQASWPRTSCSRT